MHNPFEAKCQSGLLLTTHEQILQAFSSVYRLMVSCGCSYIIKVCKNLSAALGECVSYPDTGFHYTDRGVLIETLPTEGQCEISLIQRELGNTHTCLPLFTGVRSEAQTPLL